ncbi:uncharacterized protein LOC127136651 [Lathyrus oleraceus]|uniref:uncharacterized protein LOC127136651 n=1 Tax=Pisum sativum TaxID=3888 RepID=UPI0021D29BBC|nr:uncharacterized protein LOC127136651 [Pisum sativum]
MASNEQAPSSSNPNPTVTGVVSTPIYKEPHILDREPHINLATPLEKLEVLCESLVDFDNMRRNDIDLTDELRNQAIPLDPMDPAPAKEPTPSTPEAQAAPEKSSDDDEHLIAQVLKKPNFSADASTEPSQPVADYTPSSPVSSPAHPLQSVNRCPAMYTDSNSTSSDSSLSSASLPLQDPRGPVGVDTNKKPPSQTTPPSNASPSSQTTPLSAVSPSSF